MFVHLPKCLPVSTWVESSKCGVTVWCTEIVKPVINYGPFVSIWTDPAMSQEPLLSFQSVSSLLGLELALFVHLHVQFADKRSN